MEIKRNFRCTMKNLKPNNDTYFSDPFRFEETAKGPRYLVNAFIEKGVGENEERENENKK